MPLSPDPPGELGECLRIERRIEDELKRDVDIEEKCSALVELALAEGATDNVTLVLVQGGEVGA